MDEIDAKILKLLSKNADVTSTEISSNINLSVPAINKRIQKLRQIFPRLRKGARCKISYFPLATRYFSQKLG